MQSDKIYKAPLLEQIEELKNMPGKIGSRKLLSENRRLTVLIKQ